VKLIRVNPDKIEIPELRVTARFTEEVWEQFKSSMKEVGQVAPIICCWVDNRLILVDGLHRLIEARQNGATKVDVACFEGTEVDVLTRNLFLDHTRGKTPVSEMILVIKALWKDFNLDSEQIAAKTGMTRDYVEKLQKLSALTPMALASLDQERIGVGHAHALTRIKDPITQETVLHQQELYRWSIKELEEYIDGVLAIQQKREATPRSEVPTEPYKFRCAFCGGMFEAPEVANPTTCRGCSGMMFAAIATAKAEAKAVADVKDKGTPAS